MNDGLDIFYSVPNAEKYFGLLSDDMKARVCLSLITKLAEANEAIRLANEQIDVSPTFEDERVSYVEVQMDRGFRAEWLNLPAVKRALGEGK